MHARVYGALEPGLQSMTRVTHSFVVPPATTPRAPRFERTLKAGRQPMPLLGNAPIEDMSRGVSRIMVQVRNPGGICVGDYGFLCLFANAHGADQLAHLLRYNSCSPLACLRTHGNCSWPSHHNRLAIHSFCSTYTSVLHAAF